MTLRRDRATAKPSKEFFVRMLTRDISLEDCILDLVDNSIDGAWEKSGYEPTELRSDSALSTYHIKIRFSDDDFSIVDNCGGITLDNAADYAFTFGRRHDQTPDDFSVGVYGIGMKRAVFKLGDLIEVRSTYVDGRRTESFRVPINVPEWMARDAEPLANGELAAPNWDFDIEESDPLSEPGVAVHVSGLRPETSERLGDPTFERRLRRILGRDYMVPLMRGLRISVNGVAVVGYKLELRGSDDFAPMRDRYTDGSVTVEILAGMVSVPPDSAEPDENDRRKIDPSGWYILCNGRVVLAADTSNLTGWGEELPRWHRQYSGFAGIALFSAARAADLPMTTTKRSVDVSHAVYRRALARMHEPTRTWISYTNARKFDLDEAKHRERSAEPKELVAVEARPTVRVPTLATPTPTRERIGNINYAMPYKRIKALAKGLGDSQLSYRDVGIKSFDYAYETLVGEDD
ncbi:ATP-binding protein [Nostocoides sp. Soil756]|uniref:ATP-binding protein n=1 Tax=Nostocoides sp. Soil756 TaxID=1736399 RepID=UPI0006F62F53|nr:ATP-binding protein [Tetrasphaera sp. Soil756]KRE63763.1 hypothetical protein ASG78_01230 [Tetrasphaera sp. Soil756]